MMVQPDEVFLGLAIGGTAFLIEIGVLALLVN